MITLETNRTTQVFSNAAGNSKDNTVKAEDRLFSSSAKQTRSSNKSSSKTQISDIKSKAKSGELSKKEARKEIKKARKIKRGAIKLQLTKRSTQYGKPVAIYRLKKLEVDKRDGKIKKKNADGTTKEVSKTDVITTPQGQYDVSDIAKATNLPVDQIKSNPEIVKSVTTAVTTESATAPTATETSKSDASADLAVQVPASNIYNASTDSEGSLSSTDVGFLKSDTESTDATDENKNNTDQQDETKTKKPMKTWEKVLLFGGIAVVLGLVGFAIYKGQKNGK